MQASISKLAVITGFVMVATGCSSVCDSPLGRPIGFRTECNLSDWNLSASLKNVDNDIAVNRFDLRKQQPIRVSLVVENSVLNINSALVEPPIVEESRNGSPFVNASVTPVPGDRKSWYTDLLLPPQVSDEHLGQIAVRVAVKDQPALPVQSVGQYRVFRSPRLERVELVSYASNPLGPTPIVARTGVQVGSPLAGFGTVLVTEQYMFGIEPRRWLDLFAPDQAKNGALNYNQSSSAWNATKPMLVEPIDAQLVVASGTVFMYRTDGVTLRKDLAMLPVGGSQTAGLSRFEPNIPADGLRLAGCADDSVLALSRPGSILFFQTDAKNSAKPVQLLGELAVKGTSVLATRDVAAAIPANTSNKYFAVYSDGAGSLSLVELIRVGQAPSAVKSTPLGTAVTGGLAVTALALADLDSDGLQDIVLGREDGSIEWSPQLPSSASIPVFERATPLSLVQPLPAGSYAAGLSVGNIVADVAPDLAVATSKNQVFIYSNQK